MNLEKDYYKSSNWYSMELSSEMTNSDIWEIMLDKYSEIDWIKYERATLIKWMRWKNRQIIDLLYNDYVSKLEKIITTFKYLLKLRDTRSDDFNIIEKLQEAKNNISILDFIECTAHIECYTRKLNKCPLPNHRDWTASFKIYDKTNTWYCFWCKIGGDIVNFIEELTSCNRKDAIMKIISLNK